MIYYFNWGCSGTWGSPKRSAPEEHKRIAREEEEKRCAKNQRELRKYSTDAIFDTTRLECYKVQTDTIVLIDFK